jgi:hypothetical protein
MKRIVLAAAAVGMFALSSGAFAQDEKLYLTEAAGKKMVMGGADAAGTELLVGTGAKPAECPSGHFYTTDASQQMVMKCDDDMQFSLAAPESGAMTATGEPYPEGSMIMTPSQ